MRVLLTLFKFLMFVILYVGTKSISLTYILLLVLVIVAYNDPM